MRKTTFLLVVALAVAFLGLALVAYGLPKDKQAPAPSATTTAKPSAQRAVVHQRYIEANDMDNINVAAPPEASEGYPDNYIGAQQPLYPVVNGVPYVDVRKGSTETAGGNNRMRRRVQADGSGVIHMAYRIFDADSGGSNGSGGRFGDTVYSAADSNTNGNFYYNAYDCGGGNNLLCDYTASNGKCYRMIRPPDSPETRPSILGGDGGLFVKPGTGQGVVYGQRYIKRTDIAEGLYSLRGWGTAVEGGACTPTFSMDTSYNAFVAPLAAAPVIHPLDANVWVGTFRNGNFPEEIGFSYTTDAGLSWSTRVVLGTNSPWFNSTEIASSGNTFWIVSMADPADPTAFQTTERPVYLKGTYSAGTVTFGTEQDITGNPEYPGFLGNMLCIAATNIGDTLVVAWNDWNNFAGNGFAGPGGHVHSALVFPDGSIELHKIANIDIDGRLPKMSTTLFGFGTSPWAQIALSYGTSSGNLYCIWGQPPPDGNYGWADYERTQTLANMDLFRSVSPNHGRAWDNPVNITKTNNPGCRGRFGTECAHEWWFSADDRVSNDTVAIIAIVNAYPGIQEGAVESGITPDVGPWSRSRDLVRLYKMPADTAKRDLRADLNSLPTDTVKLFSMKTEPGHAPFSVDVKLENIGLQDFFLDSVKFDPAMNSGGLTTTSNAVSGTLVNIGGSYSFQVTFNASAVPINQQGLHSGLLKAYLRSTTAPNSPEGTAATNVTLNVNLSLYIVQTLCVNRKVTIHSGSNHTDVGSQGSIKDQAGLGMFYDFDGSDHFYDGSLWVYRSNLNAAAGVPGVPRKVTRQLFSDKFLRCVQDIVLDSTAGTGPYYNFYAVSVSTDVEDTTVLYKNIWEQCGHADSSDFLLQTVKAWNIGPTVPDMALGVAYDIDCQGGGSAASENTAGDTSFVFDPGGGNRTFWLGWISGNDVTIDTCSPNNAYYGVVILANGVGNPGDSVHPRGALMYEQQGFSYNTGNGNAAGGDSLCQRYMKNLTVSSSARRRYPAGATHDLLTHDTLTGVWQDTLSAPIGIAAICGGVANPSTYREEGMPYRNDEGYMAVAKRISNFAPTTPLTNLVSRYGLQGAGAQLASSVDSSFPGSVEYQVIHLASVSGIADLIDHAKKAIKWSVNHHNYQTGPHQIDTTGATHYFVGKKGDYNNTGSLTAADVGIALLDFVGVNASTYQNGIPACVSDVGGNGGDHTGGTDLARLLLGVFATTPPGPGSGCPLCLELCGF